MYEVASRKNGLVVNGGHMRLWKDEYHGRMVKTEGLMKVMTQAGPTMRRWGQYWYESSRGGVATAAVSLHASTPPLSMTERRYYCPSSAEQVIPWRNAQ